MGVFVDKCVLSFAIRQIQKFSKIERLGDFEKITFLKNQNELL